jgi:hypothetical protein
VDERNREPNVYAAPPKLFAPIAAAVALLGAVLLLALGHVIFGSAVLGLAVLALLAMMQDLVGRSSRLVSEGYGRARALSGYAGTSLRTWSRTGGRVARLRVESHRILRERREAQLALGAATYAGDERAVASLIERLRTIDEQLSACVEEMDRAIAEARSRVAQERLAVSSTEIRRAR